MFNFQVPKISNIFDDKEISSDKLNVYRSSKPLSFEHKGHVKSFLNFKQKTLQHDQSSLSSTFFQDSTALFSRIDEVQDQSMITDVPQKLRTSKKIRTKISQALSWGSEASLIKSKILEDEWDDNKDIQDNFVVPQSNVLTNILEVELKLDSAEKAKESTNQRDEKVSTLNIAKCSPVHFHDNNTFHPSSVFESESQDLEGAQDSLFGSIRKDLESKPIVYTVEKIDQGTDAIEFEEEVIEQVVPPIMHEISLDTEGLMESHNQCIQTEQKEFDDQACDTQGLMVSHDQAVETGNELIEAEKEEAVRKALEEEREETFITEALLKDEVHSYAKQNRELRQKLRDEIEQNSKNCKESVLAGINAFTKQREIQEKKKIIAVSSNLQKTREELVNFRSEVVSIIDTMKDTVIQDFKLNMEGDLKSIIQNYTNQRVLELGVAKLSEYFNENQSVSTESSFGTPIKQEDASESGLDPTLKPRRNSKKNAKKVDKTIIEGMLYLLQNGALKNHQGNSLDLKIIQDLMRTRSLEQITPDLIFDNLMSKTRQKRVDYKESVDKEPKRRSQRQLEDQTKKKVHTEQSDSYDPLAEANTRQKNRKRKS